MMLPGRPREYNLNKRKLTAADGAAVIAQRLRKDLSLLFDIPCVPNSVAPASQPPAFRGTLFGYQRRSLARMLEIETGTRLTVEIGVRTETFAPKGGVVADTVGMGKTAQLIALLLAKPPPPRSKWMHGPLPYTSQIVISCSKGDCPTGRGAEDEQLGCGSQ